MFSPKFFVALLVFAAPFLVRADVTPTRPAPQDIYNEGSTCYIAWQGDTISTTLWKSMDIELMTGNNTDMVSLAKVATGEDGTIDNQIGYPCPKVTPNSFIYFYQFTTPLGPNITWTGRFAIGTPTGGTTPPPFTTKDADGTIVLWGVGQLVNSSSSIAISNSSSTASSSYTLPVAVPSSTTGSATADITPSASSDSSGSDSSEPSATSTSQSTSGAMTTFDNMRVLGAAAVATLVLSFVW